MFDDMHNLLWNSRLAINTLDLTSLQSASLSSGSGLLRRPVSMASFALNRYFFGIDPYSYKVINLVIHLLTGAGLFLLGRMILKSYRIHQHTNLPAGIVTWIPVIACGIWLVHPLNLTTVLYIVQRMASLSALFTVLGLCCYTAGRYRLIKGQRGWPWILSGVFLFGTLAVFSKESGALMPLYMLVIEMTVFHFRSCDQKFDRSIAVFFGLFLLLPACGFFLWLASQPGAFLSGYTNRDFNLEERLMTEARVLTFYLKQVFLPSLSELGLYHDDIVISRSLLEPVSTLSSILFLLTLLTAGVLLAGKAPLVSLGIFWFFAGHVLESTILPLEIAHEHRNYLADFGIIFAACSLIIHYRPGTALRRTMVIAPALLIAVLSYTTWVRAEQWSDNVNHALFEVMHHPESPRAAFSAGRIHARLAINGHADSEAKAFHYLQLAGDLNKSGILPEVVMIKLAHILDEPVQEAWYEKIIEKLRLPISSADLNALHILGLCQESLCTTPSSTMEAIYQTAFDNESLMGPKRLAHAYTSYGYYKIKSEANYKVGRQYFTKAVETYPKSTQNWINLLKLLLVTQDFDAAERWLNEFRSADAAGASEKDYLRFQKSILNGRLQLDNPSRVTEKDIQTGH